MATTSSSAPVIRSAAAWLMGLALSLAATAWADTPATTVHAKPASTPVGLEPATPKPSAAAPASPAAAVDAAPQTFAPLPEGERLIGDSTTMVARAGQGQKTLSDVVGREEARTIMEINRKKGTYITYMLATSPDLPDKFFEPGFAITIKDRKPPGTGPAPPPQPAPTARATKRGASRQTPASAPATPPPSP